MKPEAFLKNKIIIEREDAEMQAIRDNKKETVKKMIGRAKFLIQILYLY